uniref:Uncharacterized protein n=1 Tax=viral metagenome TaxID=1070528 RepID=A0A6M3IPH3_9ZZZZ
MNLSSLHNLHSGRCFLLGNGASLALAPFPLLSREPTFAVNRIAKLFPLTAFRPTFFVAASTTFDEWYYKAINAVSLSFVWDEHRSRIDAYTEHLAYFSCTHTSHYEPSAASSSWWQPDITKGVCKFGTSLLAAAQIAVYLGFSPLYFIGCDLGMDAFSLDYYTEAEQEKRTTIPPSYITSAFVAAHRIIYAASQQHHFAAYNATMGGALEVYPRVDLLELLAETTQLEPSHE